MEAMNLQRIEALFNVAARRSADRREAVVKAG